MVCRVEETDIRLVVVTDQLDELATLGTSYQFSLAIQLAVGNLSDLSVHISGTAPESNTSSLHLCSPTITDMAAGQVRELYKVRKKKYGNFHFLVPDPP